MQMELIIRFDYGSIVPWVRTMDGHLRAIAGPDALSLWTSATRRQGPDDARRVRRPGRRADPVPADVASRRMTDSPEPFDALAALDDTERWWRDWCAPLHVRRARGEIRWCARSSRSRRSRSRRPAASLRRRRRRCRRRSAACGTGTIATAGCATPPTRCTR